MDDTDVLIANLRSGPQIVTRLIREMPDGNLKRRPSEAKWSAHEHACHISTGEEVYLARLEKMLSEAEPHIEAMQPSADEEAGSLLERNLGKTLDGYVKQRALTVKRLEELSASDWQRTATHEAYSHYSVFIMFRDLFLHEMLHAFRIEELLLKKDW